MRMLRRRFTCVNVWVRASLWARVGGGGRRHSVQLQCGCGRYGCSLEAAVLAGVGT